MKSKKYYKKQLSNLNAQLDEKMEELSETKALQRKAIKQHRKWSKYKQKKNTYLWDESHPNSPSKYIKYLSMKAKKLSNDIEGIHMGIATCTDTMNGVKAENPRLPESNVVKVIKGAESYIVMSGSSRREIARKLITEEVERFTEHTEPEKIAKHIETCLLSRYGSKAWKRIIDSMASSHLVKSLKKEDILVYLQGGTYSDKQLNSSLGIFMEAYEVVRKLDHDNQLDRVERKIDVITNKALSNEEKREDVISRSKAIKKEGKKINITMLHRETGYSRDFIRRTLRQAELK
ncbi:TPA: hypothetical protein ACF5BZ_003858 [Vibrio parahaemolyticus]